MLEINNLSKFYGKHRALKNATLTVYDGEVFALLGPNGSGKSTLLKSLLGVVHSDNASSITFNGNIIFENKAYRSIVGYMPQISSLPKNLKVKEIISLFVDLKKRSALFKDKIISDLDIGSFWSKSIGELSGGMLQKVNILQAFMFDNKLYMLDEPTLGLDPNVTFYIKKLINEKRKNGDAVFFTSHIMSEVDELADRLALMVDGEIYTIDSPCFIKKKMNADSLEKALHKFWKIDNVTEEKK